MLDKDMASDNHKAGFVSLVGKPNVGKSTLMNVLVGENLSVITSKAQTTRHRIQGILSGDNFQIVYSDTPGIIDPKYKLHESMMDFVSIALEDADVVLFITDIYEKHDDVAVLEKLKKIEVPVICVVNKIDQVKTQEDVDKKIADWASLFDFKAIIAISALEKFNVEKLFQTVLDLMPEHPAYFPKDELTDKPERFFASEIVREKIFKQYKKEVPYCTEVVIVGFKEDDKIIRIFADILVERKSQRSIIIGNKGEAIKKLGIAARQDLETFFGKQVYLETYVKVEPDWRTKDRKLKELGYNNQ